MKSPVTGNDINLPVKEILKIIPEIFGIRATEQPVYQVITNDGDVELRQYPPATLASITLQGTFEDYRAEAFKHLAAYIFGENASHEKVAMTSPVIQREEDSDTRNAASYESRYESGSEQIAMTSPVLQKQDGQSWTMSFILPERYNLERPPEAIDPAIHFSKLNPRQVAAIKYSGINDHDKMETHKAALENWLVKNPKYKALGAVYWAQYDAPFVIPFLRRNEALVEIEMQ